MMAHVDLLYNELYDRIRGFGYTTKGQTADLVESVIDLITSQQRVQNSQEIVHDPAEIRRVFELDDAEYPPAESGFMKL